jgi:hypothetical protein
MKEQSGQRGQGAGNSSQQQSQVQWQLSAEPRVDEKHLRKIHQLSQGEQFEPIRSRRQ